jgi:hypothetical protein
MHSLKGLLTTMLALLAVAACTDSGMVTVENPVLEPDVAVFGDRLGLEPGMTVELEGRTTFGAYASRTRELVSDPAWNYLNAEGTLELTGNGHTVNLEIREYFGEVYLRTRVFTGTMTPSGRVKMAWPAGDLAQAREHTGCHIPANLKYHGFFDGEHFYVATEFHSLCDGGTMWKDFGVCLEIGPLHATFAVDLMRVD